MAKQKKHTRLKYIGDGEFIVGVPARDLSVEESWRYMPQIRATEKATGRKLYEPESLESNTPPAEEADDGVQKEE